MELKFQMDPILVGRQDGNDTGSSESCCSPRLPMTGCHHLTHSFIQHIIEHPECTVFYQLGKGRKICEEGSLCPQGLTAW